LVIVHYLVFYIIQFKETASVLFFRCKKKKKKKKDSVLLDASEGASLCHKIIDCLLPAHEMIRDNKNCPLFTRMCHPDKDQIELKRVAILQEENIVVL
jgi:hypothetical protein